MDCEEPYDAEVTESGTIIPSPNYPNLYENSKTCQISIKADERHAVTIEFLEFDVDRHEESSNTCSNDWLEVHDGDIGESAQRLCGETIPAPITSSGNSMTLVFKSNSNTRHSGFMIRVDIGTNNLNLNRVKDNYTGTITIINYVTNN